ncbi:UNVERIFIED_CONTAM: Leucine-rich repeat extensin-like protein 6 [Sesamum radiatum]|uniref:Cell wall hydroxyproline-rich glycoprotein n=1 Tax=Sesamum radiatum TaxID=300843 RepID=A0AAW2MGQ1_SESRA
MSLKLQMIFISIDTCYPTMEILLLQPSHKFENPRLENAYIALQAWKEVILSDPKNMTTNWVGPDVCNYKGVFCWPAPDNTCERTVAGIDINHADIAGSLPRELGLLYDLALFHLNSNRFCGTIPQSFVNLRLLFELDLSNNRFAGKFPELVLHLPSLNNRFSALPDNIGNSPVSVIVMANNMLEGCLPASLGSMAATLNELIITNNGLLSCFPNEIGKLKNLTVLDVSHNKLMGPLPDSIGNMDSLEQLNVEHNFMSGKISIRMCQLPNLKNFAYDHNFFSDESSACLNLPKYDDTKNCFRGRPMQRSELQCQRFLSRKVNCSSFKCDASCQLPPPSSQPHLPSPPPPPIHYNLNPPPPPSFSSPPPFHSPSPPSNPQPLPPPPRSNPQPHHHVAIHSPATTAA